MRQAAANGGPIHVEGDARLDSVRDDMKCSMKFLVADVKRPLASVSAIVDERNIVVFGPQESYIENTSTGNRIPMNRRQGVFVVLLDARAGARSTKIMKFDAPNANSVVQAASVNQECGRNP